MADMLPTAVQAFGFLLRKAPHRNLPVIVRAVLLEAAAVASPGRVHGAGAVLGESVLGPTSSLHSRTPALLEALLAQGLCVEPAVEPATSDAERGVWHLHANPRCALPST